MHPILDVDIIQRDVVFSDNHIVCACGCDVGSDVTVLEGINAFGGVQDVRIAVGAMHGQGPVRGLETHCLVLQEKLKD